MNRCKIVHRTYYNFTAPVELGPHELRLRPREAHDLHIESSSLIIEPAAVVSWWRDAEDNAVATARFSGSTRQLAILSELVVQQYNLEPLDFDQLGRAVTSPIAYSAADAAALAPYLAGDSNPGGQPRITSWLDAIGCGGRARNFPMLQRLTECIHRTLAYRTRTEPGVQAPDVTLDLGTGACRDFSALFIEAARRMGFATRFVSGYLHAQPSNVDYGATHAWVEVYLPGAGWKGFDPTTGQLAGKDHFPVAVGRYPEAVPPVSGSFSGMSSASLVVGVWVTELPTPAS